MAKVKAKKQAVKDKKTPNGGPSGIPIRIPKGSKYDEKLPCRIPEADVHKAGADLASCIRQRAEWLEKRKAENAKAREERAYFDQRIEELGQAIEQQSVTRRVTCQDYLVTRGGKPTIEIVRLDTNEVVTTREPTTGELQEGFTFDGKKDEKPGRKARGSAKAAPEPPFGSEAQGKPAVTPDFGGGSRIPEGIQDPDLD
jgi:hypothetical protein